MHSVMAKSILSPQNGMNVYRGCTHGCIYCDARSTVYRQETDSEIFEDIAVKVNAPELLEKALKSKRKKCMIGTGAMSDPYLHFEKKLEITRRCVELIDKYGFGLAVQTKSDMILRDLDLLKSINQKAKCVVQITLTTFDDDVCKIVEPNVCVTSRRIEVLNILKDEGIPTVVWLTPFLPFINGTFENASNLLKKCVESNVKGIILFGAGLTLRDGDRQYFYKQLDKHFPGLKQKYIENFHNNYEIPCPDSRRIVEFTRKVCAKHNILMDNDVFDYLHEFPLEKESNLSFQPELF